MQYSLQLDPFSDFVYDIVAQQLDQHGFIRRLSVILIYLLALFNPEEKYNKLSDLSGLLKSLCLKSIGLVTCVAINVLFLPQTLLLQLIMGRVNGIGCSHHWHKCYFLIYC